MIKNSPVIKVKIQNEDFDVSDEIKILHQNNTGAIVNFVGVVTRVIFSLTNFQKNFLIKFNFGYPEILRINFVS